jgi:hypothetical protein
MPNSNVEPPKEAAAILRMAFAFVTSQVLYVAAELGVADHLAQGALARKSSRAKLARTPARWRAFSKRWLLSAYSSVRATINSA